mgnify:CR=1 FL=1
MQYGLHGMLTIQVTFINQKTYELKLYSCLRDSSTLKRNLTNLLLAVVRIMCHYPIPKNRGNACCNQEDTCVNHHHNLLLENLLIFRKPLNISIYKREKMTKETNWKQKFQKTKNENIDLINLNSENKQNFLILGFGVYLNMEG